ncbi:hypothetical protein [Pseudomonas caspiana]|nr:hypothetical protein [Pseudomonas caspiana]
MAIDAESIVAAFSGCNSDLEDALRPSIIAITAGIIDDYDSKISRDGTGMARDWLKRVYDSPSRWRMVNHQELEYYGINPENGLHEEYVGAAYVHGHTLFKFEEFEELLRLAKKYGLKLCTPSSEIDFSSLSGHSIIESYLLNSTTNYKHNIVRKYFNQEKQIIVYDRFFKDSSLTFLENVICDAHDDVSITIISEFEKHSLLTKLETADRLKRIKPKASINCYYPDFKELSDKHDRHIHLGNRLQLTFSSGLDCFGMSPNWNNSECDIQVYYLGPGCSTRVYAVSDNLVSSKKRYQIQAFSKI